GGRGRGGRDRGGGRQGPREGGRSRGRDDQQVPEQLQLKRQERQGQRHHQPARQVVEDGVGDLPAERLVQQAGGGDPQQVRRQGDRRAADADQQPLPERLAHQQGDRGGQREEHHQHAQPAARLDHVQLDLVDVDEVPLGDGGAAEGLQQEGAGLGGDALQRL